MGRAVEEALGEEAEAFLFREAGADVVFHGVEGRARNRDKTL